MTPLVSPAPASGKKNLIENKKLDCVMEYLQEIGASWHCATNVAGISKSIMQDQHRQALDGKVVDIHNSLQIPSLNDDNDSASQGCRDRMPLQKESGPRLHEKYAVYHQQGKRLLVGDAITVSTRKAAIVA